MSKPLIIAPSILSADFTRLGDQIKQAEENGADWIHVDVMDGHFVPNLTMGPFIVEACRRATDLPLDVHLMVSSPENLLKSFADAGANSLTVHVEVSPHLHRTLQSIRQLGCKPGVALNPSTPANSIETILHMVDLVLVMTVNPGYSGQTFIEEALLKVIQIRELLDVINPSAHIQVDGGISAKTLPLAQKAGANVFVAGNAVFNNPDGIAASIQTLKDAGE